MFEGTWAKPGQATGLPFGVLEDSPQLPAGFRLLADVIRQKREPEVTIPWEKLSAVLAATSPVSALVAAHAPRR
jgi:hypothetical protein